MKFLKLRPKYFERNGWFPIFSSNYCFITFHFLVLARSRPWHQKGRLACNIFQLFDVSTNMINYVLLIKFPSFNLWHFTNRWSCFTVLHCILGSTFSWSSPYICWTWNCYQFSLWFTKFNLGKVYNASYNWVKYILLLFLNLSTFIFNH
jgi:hypothetical protein